MLQWHQVELIHITRIFYLYFGLITGTERLMVMRLIAVLFIFTLIAPSFGHASIDRALIQVQEGSAALLRGEYDKAVLLYDKALKVKELAETQRANVYNDRGIAKWRLSRLKEAIDDFNQAITLYPEYAAAYNNRGNVLIELSLLDEAVKDFDQAISLWPSYGAAYNNRANAFQKLGRLDNALRDYTKAIEFMPNNAAPINGRGKVHAASERKHAAIRDFSRAILLDGKYIPAYYNRGKVLMSLARHKDALSDYSFTIDVRPQDVELFTERGKIHAKRNDFVSALKDFSRSIAILPDFAPAFAERGLVYTRTKNYAEAMEDINHAIELDPKFADAYTYRAWAQFKLGMQEQAQADLNAAIELDPNRANTYFVRGQIHEEVGANDKAIADFRKALELDPHMNLAWTGLSRLGGDVSSHTRPTSIADETAEKWTANKIGSLYFATSPIYKGLRIPLEMYGSDEPKLLEWSSLKRSYQGIGLLRYYAGTDSSRGIRLEYIAIVDLKNNRVASIEPFRWGDKLASWTWRDGSVIVTDPNGAANEIALRNYRSDQPSRYSNWYFTDGPTGYQKRRIYRSQRARARSRARQRKKQWQKSIFESLFN